jgi:epsilon-lactone hydrolase
MSETAPIDGVIAQIQAVYGKWTRNTPVATMRRDWDEFFRARAEPLPMRKVDAGGVPGEWISAAVASSERVIFYLHGGGFCIGSIGSHRDLLQRLSRAAAARILAIDYRLAPEHRFPAALDDAVAAYRWLLGQNIQSARVAFAGDSAGAGLAISTMLVAKEQGLPLPGAGVFMSAWTDMAATGQSYERLAADDPIHQRPMILSLAKGYLGEADARDALASPIRGNLEGLPPMLLQSGGRETLIDDTLVFAERARAAGVPAEVEIFDGMIHVFQMFAAELPEARRAIAAAGAFVRRHLSMGAGQTATDLAG